MVHKEIKPFRVDSRVLIEGQLKEDCTSEKPSEPLQEGLSTEQPSCVSEEVKPLTASEGSFMSVVKGVVLEFGVDVSIKSSDGGDIYYEVYHPDFEGGFVVYNEEDFISIVEGFKTLSKFKGES